METVQNQAEVYATPVKNIDIYQYFTFNNIQKYYYSFKKAFCYLIVTT